MLAAIDNSHPLRSLPTVADLALLDTSLLVEGDDAWVEGSGRWVFYPGSNEAPSDTVIITYNAAPAGPGRWVFTTPAGGATSIPAFGSLMNDANVAPYNDTAAAQSVVDYSSAGLAEATTLDPVLGSLTIDGVAGVYQVQFTADIVETAPATAMSFRMVLRNNAVAIPAASQAVILPAVIGSTQRIVLSALVELADGDVLDVWIFGSLGTAGTFTFPNGTFSAVRQVSAA